MNILSKLYSKMSFEVLLFIVVFGCYTMFQSLYGTVVNDTWWHLKVGEQLWNGTFTFEDQFSWTAAGEFWPAHELTYEWILYGLWLLGGKTFVLASLLNSALMIATFILLLPTKKLQERVNGRINWLVPIALLLAGVVLFDFIQLRAQAFSFLFFALTIRLIVSNKPLWIPAVFLVWVWIHGSVLIGIAVLGLATLIMIGRWLIDRKNKGKAKDALYFSASGILSILATALSPLGFGLWTYFIQTFSYKDTNVREWQPIFEDLTTSIQALVIAILILIAFFRLRKVMLTWEVLFLSSTLVFIGIYSLSAIRVFGNFSLLAIPIITLALMRDWNRFPKRETLEPKKTLYWIISVSVIIASLIYSAEIARGILHATSRNPFVTNGVDKALRSEECSNKLWNDYDTGAYLIWFMPDVKVSIDSRFDVYPRWVTDAIGVTTPPGGDEDPTNLLNEVLQENRINCMLFTNNPDTDRLKARGMEVIAENKDMVLLRLDNHTIPPRVE